MTDDKVVTRLLDIIDNDISPLTHKGVCLSNKVFGAAILLKSDLSLVLAGTNNEVENPLWHGEVHTLKTFYEMPADDRPATSDCLFLSTHEPCSLCLSAITWAGFDNFYYLFGYTDTSETFNIPHDLKILQEVFAIKDGNYVRENAFWKSHSIVDMISGLSDDQQQPLLSRIQALTDKYAGLSAIYQRSKGDTNIPLG